MCLDNQGRIIKMFNSVLGWFVNLFLFLLREIQVSICPSRDMKQLFPEATTENKPNFKECCKSHWVKRSWMPGKKKKTFSHWLATPASENIDWLWPRKIRCLAGLFYTDPRSALYSLCQRNTQGGFFRLWGWKRKCVIMKDKINRCWCHPCQQLTNIPEK